MMKKTIQIYTDGGARGNPGPAACGFVVYDQGVAIKQGYKYLGESTNNVAEYQGVLEAYRWLVNEKELLDTLGVIEYHLDSKLVKCQLSGEFKIKNENLYILFGKIKDLEKEVNKTVSYQYVPREQNKVADSLVNKCLDETPKNFTSPK